MKPKSFSKNNKINKPPKLSNNQLKKDSGKPVRISTKYYEQLRLDAFQQNRSMKTILDEIIEFYNLNH